MTGATLVRSRVRTMTALDRCDRCRSQGYVITFITGLPLTWCKHHFEEHEPKLLAVAGIVRDERDWINGPPSHADEGHIERGHE